MRKLIKVTKRHIKEGKPDDFYNCPVARAIQEKLNMKPTRDGDFNDKRPVYVNLGTIRIKNFTTNAPRSVERFVARFDNTKPVKPFNFYLNLKD